MKYYYKVVAHDGGSSVTSNRNVRLKYEVGKVTTPVIPNSKIFVFNNHSAAMQYRMGNERIFLCTAKNPKPVNIYILDLLELYKDRVIKFWENHGKNTTGFSVSVAPNYTSLVDSVKIIKEIKPIL